MLTPNVFSSGSAAHARPWDEASACADAALRKHLINRHSSDGGGSNGSDLIPAGVDDDTDPQALQQDKQQQQQQQQHQTQQQQHMQQQQHQQQQQQHSGLCGTHPALAGSAAAAGADGEPSFEQLCHGGWSWSWSNWRVKLYRWTLLCIKQVYLLFMTLSLPTNHLMLTFRTLTRDFDEPHCNADHLAAKFRDELMPARGRLHHQKSTLIRINRFFVELPFLGIPGIVRFIDVRTQWFDDSVRAATRDGLKQVVIIAAGYDTRAYRLAKPGVRFYEIDLPHASKHKQELVRKLLPASEYPRPEYVAADLSKVKLADALATTSFNPNEPTLFTIEGLVYYLPPVAVEQLLRCISTISAKGSRVMMDFIHLSSMSGAVWHPGFETLWLSVWNKGEQMYSGIDERPAAVEALMRRFGFHTHIVLTARDMVKHYMPHATYRSRPPTVSPYFGYLSAEKL